MIVEETGINGLFVILQVNIENEAITYDQKEFFDQGLRMDFVQDNESYSVKNVLRGLHVQKKYPQGKLVRVEEGMIYDVAVDMRKDSQTFLEWYGLEISSKNGKQLYIPEGFAHGFFVLSDYAKISFKVTNYWHPEDEKGILWNDPKIAIDWPIKEGEIPIISEKDSNYPYL